MLADPDYLKTRSESAGDENVSVGVERASDGVRIVTARDRKSMIPEYFASLGQYFMFHAFEPVDYMASSRRVAALLRLNHTFKPTGRRTQTETVQVWTFNGEGLVADFQEFGDTGVLYALFAGTLK